MQHLLANLVSDDSGQDLAEYALLIALIALVVIAAVGTLGGRISDVFGSITGKLVTP